MLLLNISYFNRYYIICISIACIIFIQGATSSSSGGSSSVAIGGALGGALIILIIIIAVLLVLLYMTQSHQKRSRPATVGVSISIGKASYYRKM